MTRSRILSAAVLAAVLAGGVGVVAVPSAPAFAQAKKTVRPEVGKPLQDAQNLLKAKRFKEALAKIQQADAVGDKTALEKYLIAATRESAYLESHDYANAVGASEAVIASGQAGPAEVLGELGRLTQLYYQLKNYPKVVEAARRYFSAGGTDQSLRLLMIQSYYLENNYTEAARALRVQLQAEERSGKRPTQDELKLLLSCEYKQNQNSPGVFEALTLLLQYYPSNEYWNEAILTMEKQPGFPDRLELDVDHLKIMVGVEGTANGYMEAAQLALQGGFPGDAKTFLDRGYQAGLLGQGAEAPRQKRLADMAGRQAATDVHSLGQEAAAANASATGNQLVKLGDAYVSYQQYPNAIAAYQKGIQKGGLKYPDDAQMHLGIAYGLAGQRAQAHAALKAVGGGDGTQNLARLWMLQFGVP